MKTKSLCFIAAFTVALFSCQEKEVVGEDNYYEINGVSLNDVYAELTVGDTIRLTATLHPYEKIADNSIPWSDSVAANVFWKSDDVSVASVDNAGLITAKGIGTCNVYFICGIYMAQCEIVVRSFNINKLYGYWQMGNDSIFFDYYNQMYYNEDHSSYSFDGMRLNLNCRGQDIEYTILKINDFDMSTYTLKDGLKEEINFSRIPFSLTLDELEGNTVPVGNDNDSVRLAVDLRLSNNILWATCNIGALTPVDKGYYFAWAEIQTKSYFYLETYQWYDVFSLELTKYAELNPNFRGKSLDNNDDAASIWFGEDWYIPSYEEVQTLLTECAVVWSHVDSIEGYIFYNKNLGIDSPKLFLPFAEFGGCDYINDFTGSYIGAYWTSTLSDQNIYEAYHLHIDKLKPTCIRLGTTKKFEGLNIRPVIKQK